MGDPIKQKLKLSLQVLAFIAWIGIGVWVVSFVAEKMSINVPGWIPDYAILVSIALFFVIIPLSLFLPEGIGTTSPLHSADEENAYPRYPTRSIGFTLAIQSVAALAAVVWLFEDTTLPIPEDETPILKEMLIAAVAGFLGSCVTTFLAFVRHASEEKNFDPAYAPWYAGRPALGAFLALIFYFLIRGGLLAVLPGAAAEASNDLDDATIAGISGLVGLFSKNAIEKLRELFHTLFATADQQRTEFADQLKSRLLNEVPEDQRTGLAEALAKIDLGTTPTKKHNLTQGDDYGDSDDVSPLPVTDMDDIMKELNPPDEK